MAKGSAADTAIISLDIARTLEYITNLGSRNKAMRHCLKLAQEASRTSIPVMIVGETGTGKSLLAQLLHYTSPQAATPCVILDCGRIVSTDFGLELFGVAYDPEETATRPGALEKAAGGTLIIEAVNLLPLPVQNDLLRSLESKTYRRIGGETDIPVDIRLVVTSNIDLAAKVAEGGFVEELFFHLGEVTLRIPPLRKRREDLPTLTEESIIAANRFYGKVVLGVAPEAMNLLSGYDFPGNIRELYRMMAYAVSTSVNDYLTVEDIETALPSVSENDGFWQPITVFAPLEKAEKHYIGKVLSHVSWNVSAAAAILQISPAVLRRKMRLLELKPPQETSETP